VAARVVLCGAVLLALAFPLAAQADRTVVVRLTSVTLFNTPYDLAPSGPSAGDRYVVKSRLLNAVAQFGKPKGAVVGSDQGTATLLSKIVVKSVGVARLPGGTIRFQGTGKLGARTSIPVVGGTGDYAGARGTLAVASVGTAVFNTYTLKLPGSA